MNPKLKRGTMSKTIAEIIVLKKEAEEQINKIVNDLTKEIETVNIHVAVRILDGTVKFITKIMVGI